MTITRFRHDSDGVFRARVSSGGRAVDVERRGGWIVPEEGGGREVHPTVAAKLQAKLPARERLIRRRTR